MKKINGHVPSKSLPRQLVVGYIARVRKIAYGMARTLPRHVNVDDLIGAGLVGLADALARADARSASMFECYLGHRVRGAILDELRRSDPLTRPRRLFERRKERAVQYLAGALGRSPDEFEIAERMGIPSAILREHSLYARYRCHSEFGAVSGTGEDGRQFPDELNELADVRIAHTETRERLIAAIETLPKRLQTVVSLYYDYGDSLRKIGETLGVSESRVCQLHREAIEMLRVAYPHSDRPESDPANLGARPAA